MHRVVKKLSLSLLLLVLIYAQSAAAVQVKGLYEATVEVTSQDRAERIEALKTAVAEVVIKLSGRSDVLLRPDMLKTLRSPARYVQQFRYLAPTAEGDETLAQQGLRLWVLVDQQAIQGLLQQHHLPVWGSARPVVLVWLTIDGEGGEQRLITSDELLMRPVIEAQMERRGMPVVFPSSAYVADKASEPAQWQAESTINQAMDYYQSESVLAGRVYRDSKGYWQADWQQLSGDESYAWQWEERNPSALFVHGVDLLADRIASRYAQIQRADDSQRSVTLQIHDVLGLGDYARVMAYLQKLAGVSEVLPVTVESNTVTYRLYLKGQWASIARSIELGHTLRPMPLEAQDDPLAINGRYRYLP